MVDKDIEAARWFAASRRGAMLHEERAAYDIWKGDPENAARLAALQAIWRDLEPQPDVREPALAAGEFPRLHGTTAHRRQLAAMIAFVSLTAMILTRFDGGWWSTLDWWSR
jgi:ferric-dicitrate binding protein FerR (iron transport regulator)